MSEQLKVGDRVRIHGLEDDGDIYSTTVGTYIECPELDGMTGTIIEANKDGYIVREDSGDEEDFIGACLTLLERPRRKFTEIVEELITKLNELSDDSWGLDKINDAGTAELWCEDVPGEIQHFSISRDGEFWNWDEEPCYIRSAELSAIAKACEEVTYNFRRCSNCQGFMPDTPKGSGKGMCCGLDMMHNPLPTDEACHNFVAKSNAKCRKEDA